MSVEAQIAYARLRVWKHLATKTQPDDERQRVLVELLDDAYARWTDRTGPSWEMDLILEQLGDLSIHDRGHGNWSDAIESRIRMLFLSGGIYADRAEGMLMFNADDIEEFNQYFQPAMAEAWAQRGTPEADRLAGSLSGKFYRFGRQYDPRLLILMLERIEHARERDDTDAVYGAVIDLALYLDLDDEWSPPFKRNGGQFENGSPGWIGAYIENGMAWVEEHRAGVMDGEFKPEWAD